MYIRQDAVVSLDRYRLPGRRLAPLPRATALRHVARALRWVAFAAGAGFAAMTAQATTTTVTFEYGLTTSYGNTATAAQSPLGAGATGTAVAAAISRTSSTAFIGVAYSVSRDNPATDNGNVVQSSALAIFNGDANRDFLNVQRVENCTPGITSTYRLTAYRTTADTSAGSFVWNGRLAATALP